MRFDQICHQFLKKSPKSAFGGGAQRNEHWQKSTHRGKIIFAPKISPSLFILAKNRIKKALLEPEIRLRKFGCKNT
jgi:hypothetical protein